MTTEVKLPVVISNGPLKGEKIDLQIPVISAGNIITDTVKGSLWGGSLIGSLAGLAAATSATPIGLIFLAAAVLAGSTIFFIKGIVDTVREANITSILLVNAIPNSNLQIESIQRESGSWINDTDSTIPDHKAITNDKNAGALLLNSEPSGGSSTGSAEIKITFARNFHASFKITWHNPLGPNQSRSRYTSDIDADAITQFIQAEQQLQTAIDIQGAAGAMVKSKEDILAVANKVPFYTHQQLTSPDGKTRHDVIVFVVFPTGPGLSHCGPE